MESYVTLGPMLGQLPPITVLIVDPIKQALVLIKSGRACWMEHGMELYHTVVVMMKVRCLQCHSTKDLLLLATAKSEKRKV